MPGLILHSGATITCSHAGQATPTASIPRVLVSGQPVVVMGSPYVIAGCPLPSPPAANGPCITGQFTTASTRVLVNGMPVLINPSPSLCAPTGTPMMAAVVQSRVVAT